MRILIPIHEQFFKIVPGSNHSHPYGLLLKLYLNILECFAFVLLIIKNKVFLCYLIKKKCDCGGGCPTNYQYDPPFKLKTI